MASIEERRDPAGKLVGYRVRWREIGRANPRSRQFRTLKLAKEAWREADRAERLGLRWTPGEAREDLDLQSIAQAWLRDAARFYAPATLVQHAHRLDLWFRWLKKRARGQLWPELLTYPMLADYHLELNGFEGGARTEATRNKYVRTVQQLWQWAWEHEYDLPRPRTLRLRAPVRPLTQAPSWEQCDAAVRALEGVNEWGHVLAVVCRYTGLRDGQADRLLWSDFDLEAGTMTVRGELGKTRAEQQGRRLPISRHLVEYLSGLGRREGFVVPLGDRKQRIVRQRVLRRAWERAEVAPELWQGQPGHAFRKAFISELERAGVREAAVEYYVGHDQRIRGVYVTPEALGLDKVAAAVSEIGSGSGRVRAVSKLDERRRQSGSAKG